MRTRGFSIGLLAVLASLFGQTTSQPDPCSTGDNCFTPARGPNCPPVRFGWGNCPGSRQACDWCYGPNGVFAYSPRGSVYTLSSGCNQFGPNTTWSTTSSQTMMQMTSAGGNCAANGKGGYNCTNVDQSKFRTASQCAATGTSSPPSSPASQNCGSTDSCYTPARGANCPPVRFGWGNCPGSRQACDWCYGPNGVFAYSPRGSVYTLSSGCNSLGPNATWSTASSQTMMQMSQAGGNCASNGKGGYNCTNVDPAKFKQASSCGSPSTFTYFYINGINTPSINNDWRGSCQSEHDTAAMNLVGDKSVNNPQVPRARGTLASIKVGTETDTMYGLTCNPSGQDPWPDTKWVTTNCPKQGFTLFAPVCPLVNLVNSIRSGAAFGIGMTPGDLWECARQSLTWPSGMTPPKGFDITSTAQDPLVVRVATAIVSMYQQEQGGTKNYFVVIGHSQGNFFVEGVAYNLLHSQGSIGQQIFAQRLGLIALASPTNYDTLRTGDPTGSFLTSKVVHHTRADDGINIVATIANLVGAGNALTGGKVAGKMPWPPNDASLWPWPGWLPVRNLFAPNQLLPAVCDPSKPFQPGANCDPSTAPFFQRLGYNAGPGVQNPELYVSLMNSHLLDNYLDVPTATLQGITLAPDRLMPFAISPRTTTVLNCIRRDLLKLKKNLLNATSSPVTTTCAGE